METEEKWAVFQYANNVGGQIGKHLPTQSSAILNFMNNYEISVSEWESGVKSGKYVVKRIP